MIVISGFNVNPHNIINKYSLDNTEEHVLNSLYLSNEVYNYEYFNQLQFELTLRSKIVEAAVELEESDFSFKPFKESFCNTDYWTRMYNGGFLLKEDIHPRDGINDIYEHSEEYGSECSTAITIIYYKALTNLFPERLFNKLFQRLRLMNWHYIDSILSDIIYMEKVKDYLPGDRRYFDNPDVTDEKAEWAGENVIYLNDNLYFGHGIGIKTPDEIITDLNKHRKKNSLKPAILLETAGRPNFKYLANIYYNYIF